MGEPAVDAGALDLERAPCGDGGVSTDAGQDDGADADSQNDAAANGDGGTRPCPDAGALPPESDSTVVNTGDAGSK